MRRHRRSLFDAMTRAMNRIEGVEKIAVLRANALGDFILTLPALEAIQSAYPNAEIVLLGKEWHAAFLRGRPAPLHRVIVLPNYRGVSQPDTWAEESDEDRAAQDLFFTEMQEEQFDLALQMHGGGGNSNPFLLRLGAHVTAGFRAPGAPALDRWMPYEYWQHEIFRQLELAALVGAFPQTVEPHITVTQADLHESCRTIAEEVEPLVVLHPGASDPRRRWSPRSFAQVGDQLAQSGFQVVVIGVPSELKIVESVIEAMKEPAINACSLLSTGGLAGLLSRARLVIANDSGPRHLAEAVGAPTVGIFWCGNLINAGSVFRTYHRPHLSWQIHCPVCGKNILHEPCPHEVSFVNDVRVEDVMASALDLLAQPRAADG
jgi:ADP-heptose:LPS heptosyltransferase